MAVINPATPAAGGSSARYIQHYELIRELGRGGMGVVHLARDLRLGRLVAIKMLTRPGHREERFLAEAQATARCRHENIVIIHDVGVHGDQPYLVFEYLRGQTLRQWMDARLGGALELHDSSGEFTQTSRPLTPARAAEMIVPVVRALVCAHDMSIIHRDLKPANILLTDEGVTKVLDFGVAKIGAVAKYVDIEAEVDPGEPPAITALGARMGTLPYMSPEQLAGEAVDHRSDIWAVGLILYELMTGTHPLAPLSMAKIHLMADLGTPMPNVREQRSDLGPLVDIIGRCLVKDREYRTATARDLLQELGALLPMQRPRARDEDSNPFAGLAAFQEDDADRFFGRDHDITSLVAKLRSVPLVAVTGPSGAGKSSLIRAGVIPALKRSGEGWEAIVTRPGHQPLATLADVLLALSVRSSEMDTGRGITRGADRVPADRDAVMARLRIEPGYLGIALRTWARARLRRLVLVVDQFEELYTLGASNEERSRVLACLGSVADDVASPLRVILSVRSDFLDRLAEQRAFLDTVSHGLTFLPLLDRDSLREALTRPVEEGDHRFESPAMIERILDELEATRSPLPLLQFTADKLWVRRDRGRHMLTESSLHALGGVSGALAQHAEGTLRAMPPANQTLVREVFRHLVTADGTRAVLRRSELNQLLGSSEAAAGVLEILIRARLLVASEGDAGEDRVEVVHEALLSSWPRLVGWQREDAESARLRDQLRAAARQWVERNRPRGMLWRGDALLEYRVWRARYQGALTDAEHEFARASLREETRGRRLRRLAVGTAFVVLCAGLVIVLQQRDRADAAALRATAERDRAEALANESRQRLIALYLEQGRQKLAEGDPLRAFPYLAEARKSGEDGTAVRFLLARAMQALDGQELVLHGHQGPVWEARFSPDGARIATASGDKTARIWDARSGALVQTLSGFDADVRRVRFTPDGQRLLTASGDAVTLWSVATGAPLWTSRHQGPVIAAAISHDGTMVATSGLDRAVKLWHTDDGRLLRTLPGLARSTLALAFSPDDAYLVTGSADQSARVWRTDTGAPVTAREDHGERVLAVAVSADGARVASLGWTGRGRVFPLRGGRTLALDSPDDSRHIAFAPDGQRLVTASEDGMARVWDATTGALLWTLDGHQNAVVHAAFTPDGQSIVTASLDGTARRWSARTGRLEWTYFGHRGGIWTTDVEATGARLLTASSDGTARVWNARQQRHVRALHAPDSVLVHASFAPDGQRVATIDRGGTVQVWSGEGAVTATMQAGYAVLPNGLPHRVWWSPDGTRLLSSGGARAMIWDARTGELLRAFEHGGGLSRATWSRDGARIATGAQDGTAQLWDARTGELLRTLTGHAQLVTAAELDPAGRWVLTTSLDGTARLWDAATGASLRTLAHDNVQIAAGRYGVDGASLITASTDAAARIFTAGGEPLQRLDGHSGPVWDAALGPDGRIAVTASADGTARVWDALAGTWFWTVDLDKKPVHSVEISADGRFLLLAAGETAEVLDVTFEDRPARALAAFSMCRVGYVVERGQLARVDADPAICAGQR